MSIFIVATWPSGSSRGVFAIMLRLIIELVKGMTLEARVEYEYDQPSLFQRECLCVCVCVCVTFVLSTAR